MNPLRLHRADPWWILILKVIACLLVAIDTGLAVRVALAGFGVQ